MKTFFSFKIILCLILLRFGLVNDSALAATLTVTPSAISNTFTGMITFQLGGLTNGETVVVERFVDADTNGVIGAADFLTQSFRVTDGSASTIGGKTNVSVPGDATATNGAITTLLNYERIDTEHIIGNYVFKLSSPSGRFTPVTAIFGVTNTAYLQSFTGQVRSNGTLSALPNAYVILFGTNRGGNNFVGGAVANNLGDYTIKAPPGTYQLAAFKSNFVGNTAVLPATLGAGVIVTNNVNAILATRTISGRVADASNTNIPLPGIFIFFQSTTGLAAIGFTDTTGNFNVPVTGGSWKIKPQDWDVAVQGYVQDGTNVSTVGGSVSNVNILLPKGTALFYGSIKDDLGNPLPGFDISGSDQNQFDSDGLSDANGNYAAVALAGTWSAQLSSDEPRLTNYVYSWNSGNITFSNGQAVRQDFVLKLATNHITGFLKDNNNTPISGVRVFGNANINGTNYQTGDALTDSSGNYSLNVANGSWDVSLNCCNVCDDGLSPIYQCPSSQNINISGGNGVVNFIVQLCAGVQITTTNLANGEVDLFYDAFLNATSCTNNDSFTWSLNSGSLPPGLQLNSGGEIFGAPTNSGTFTFIVQVIDQLGSMDNQSLTLTVIGSPPPLQVTTALLPTATVGGSYNATLSATGGHPPYTWTLAPGSLPVPAGLSLASNGVISGTPTTSGTNDFMVGVTDANFSATNRSLRIIVNPKPTLGSPGKISSSQFQLRLTGVSNQNYTLQYSITLTNWISFLTNNSASNSFNILDSNATNGFRFYRALIGP